MQKNSQECSQLLCLKEGSRPPHCRWAVGGGLSSKRASWTLGGKESPFPWGALTHTTRLVRPAPWLWAPLWAHCNKKGPHLCAFPSPNP